MLVSWHLYFSVCLLDYREGNLSLQGYASFSAPDYRVRRSAPFVRSVLRSHVDAKCQRTMSLVWEQINDLQGSDKVKYIDMIWNSSARDSVCHLDDPSRFMEQSSRHFHVQVLEI